MMVHKKNKLMEAHSHSCNHPDLKNDYKREISSYYDTHGEGRLISTISSYYDSTNWWYHPSCFLEKITSIKILWVFGLSITIV